MTVDGRNAKVWWRLPANSDVTPGTATGFLVQLFEAPPNNEKLLEKTTLLNVLSTEFHNLKYHHDYRVLVRLINCGSHGPASKPFNLRINSQGKWKPPVTFISPIYLFYIVVEK